MLSKNQVVKARKALESLYEGKCDLYEYEKYEKANGSNGFHEVLKNSFNCRLSYMTVKNSEGTESGANIITQVIKVFIPPEINVKAGSKLVITQNGKAVAYSNSGEPALYSTHQEVVLKLFEGWS